MIPLAEYFRRIGYTGSKEPTFATLEAIQAAQAYSIPFENFDISLNSSIVLDYGKIFDKLVTKNRGGYCYEVNALLHYALQSLGFKSKLCLARLMDDNQVLLPASVHMVLIVELEKRWLVDVGWGNGFVQPFCIDTPDLQHGHRIAKDSDGYIFFYRGDKKLYRFTLDEHPLNFFEARHRYHQTAPHSPFANEVACSLPTPQGYKMIQGSVYTTKSGEEKTEKNIETDEEYRALLKDEFNLHLNVNRPVWLQHEGHILHLPRNTTDWNDYHRIRVTQIHERYCPELTYDPNDPEEKDLNHFPLVFRKEGEDKILGTIRVDLLPNNEASFRWIAIDPAAVRKGVGTKMLQLAQRFVKERGRTVIRIPATAQSMPFAHHMGFKEEPWDAMPKEECMIAVCKRL